MGICCSCESTSVAMARLILDDGRLWEYPYSVKVSYVLQRNPAYFICNSDEMDFGNVVSAVSDDEELQPGRLYFSLSLSQLRHRLQAEEMAALAVKASSAVTKSGDCGGEKCVSRWNNLVFPGDSGMRQSRKAASGGNVGDAGSGRRRRDGGAWRRGKIEARLSAIPE
ncbi:hypothetical protein PHJA_002529500 [Phtheirospermum japonicum]|uniref:Uncharacterized protein n=1 Tax=Phtheirospermum japonicum TaxID=374723 RepID=A0A830CX92_9LAMI|nr:hypothetical protein PHJA_002529500 [Phtheirospermum japonicum]